MRNLFANIPRELPEELVEVLAQGREVRIERIISAGHASPPDFWYDQADDEWVLLLEGAAKLRFEDRDLELRRGDFVYIAAHERHRVEWTAPDQVTIWLAMHFQA